MHIFKVKLPFYPPGEVKYGLQNEVSTSRAFKMAFKSIIKKCVLEDALVS